MTISGEDAEHFSVLSLGTGCGAAWLARLTGGQEVPGSNPGSPTEKLQLTELRRRLDKPRSARMSTVCLRGGLRIVDHAAALEDLNRVLGLLRVRRASAAEHDLLKSGMVSGQRMAYRCRGVRRGDPPDLVGDLNDALDNHASANASDTSSASSGQLQLVSGSRPPWVPAVRSSLQQTCIRGYGKRLRRGGMPASTVMRSRPRRHGSSTLSCRGSSGYSPPETRQISSRPLLQTRPLEWCSVSKTSTRPIQGRQHPSQHDACGQRLCRGDPQSTYASAGSRRRPGHPRGVGDPEHPCSVD